MLQDEKKLNNISVHGVAAEWLVYIRAPVTRQVDLKPTCFVKIGQ